MTIVSYAQNFEDVILWRALKHIGCGFYIDIGAQDPVVDSVSCAFYEKGWRGVHVEPTRHYANKLREARRDEEVIEAAVGSERDRIAFWEFPETGLSTGDVATARLHEQANRHCVEIEVPCLRLGKLLDRYRDRDIHWLKIDVEGMERSVIRGWRPSKVRPWIVVVESTRPLSAEENFASWEPLLIKLGYEFVYFDGLNRFYVSDEHAELSAKFGPGPNVFDDAVLSISTPFCLDLSVEERKLRNQLTAASGRNGELSQLLDAERARLATLSEGFAKALSAWEHANAILTAELASKDKVIARHEKQIYHLEDENAKFAAEGDRLAETAKVRGDRIERLEDEISRRRAENDQLRQTMDAENAAREKALSVHVGELARLAQQESSLRLQLKAVYDSTSWQLTEPLRVAALKVRWGREGAEAWLKFKQGSRPHRVVMRLRQAVSRRSKSQSSASISIPRSVPTAVQSVDSATKESNVPAAMATPTSASEIEMLTPRAREILVGLRAAISRRQG